MALTDEERATLEALTAKASQPEESAPAAEVAGETAAEVGAAVAEAVADVAQTVAQVIGHEVGQAHDESDKVAELTERVDTAELIAETALAVAVLAEEEEPAEVEAAADVIEEAAETVEEAVEQLDEHHDDAGGGDESDDAPQVKAHPWFKKRGKGQQ